LPARFAEVRALRGEVDQACAWRETGDQKRDSGTALVRCAALVQNLHGDPRWRRFLRKMNLAADQLS
jgi:hypothetical protein